MEVKTESGGTFDAAGNGTKGMAITGLATGITALLGGGLLGLIGNRNCGNWNGNYNGNWNGNCHHPNFVTEEEFNLEKKVDALTSALEREKAERYTDASIIQYNKDKYEFNEKIASAIVEDRQRLASLEQYNQSLREIFSLKEELMNQKFCNLEGKISSGLAIESERRCNGDANVYNYCKATFVPGKLIMPASSICPECMPRYNSFVAPTENTTTTTTVTPVA